MKSKSLRRKRLLFIVALVLVCPLAISRTIHSAPQNVLQTVIEFKPNDSFPKMSASESLGYPIQCAGNGTAFLQMYLPPDYVQQRIYSVSSSDVHQFDSHSITDLRGIYVRGYFALDSGLLMLVNGAAEENSRQSREKHDYIAKFAEDGSYQEIIKLDSSLIISQVAAFPDGNLLALGVRDFDKTLQVTLLNSDGSILRLLEFPPKLKTWAKNQLASVPGLESAGGSLLPTAQTFVARGKIVVVPSQSEGLVFEVSEGGAIRTVNVQIPTGHVILAFVPSEDHWYVRTASEAQKPNTSMDMSKVKMALYEVSPQNGKIIREIQPKNATYDDIGCATGQEFSAFHRDQKGNLVSMQATIQ